MRGLIRLGLACALVLALTVAAVIGQALWFARAAPLPAPAATLVVLGGEITHENRLGRETRGRVRAAVRLYAAGLAPRVHFTGGSEGFGRPPAGEQMRELAVRLGVPADATSAETQSQSTLQNALLSRPVLGRLADRPVILVSDGFHLARAWASFRWAGYPRVELAAASAFGQQARAGQALRVGREALAWWFNLARVRVWEALRTIGGPGAAPIGLLR